MADEPHVPCAICGDPVLRRKGEPLNKWRLRLGCSALCSKRLHGRLTVGNLPPKNCVICDIEFTIREDQAARAFMAQKTCGAEECKRQAQSQHSPSEHLVNRADWHRETWPVDYAGGFGRTTIEPGDTRGHIPLRPATHVQKQSSIA